MALTDILGSEEKAIQYASEILRVHGQVIPVTSDNVNLVATLEDGSIIRGETLIDEPEHDGTVGIKSLTLDSKAVILKSAEDAILNADFVVLGPGDLFTSIIPNLIVGGMSKTLINTKAELVYVSNLMTKYGQTYSMTAKDHLTEITKYVGRVPNCVIVNNGVISQEMASKYKEQGEFQGEDDLKECDCRIERCDLLARDEVVKKSGDVLRRSLVRHDSHKLAEVIMSLMK